MLRGWARITRRRWPLGLASLVVVLLLGTGLLFLTRPIYRAEAALRLGQPPPPGGVTPSAGVLSFFQLGGDPFSNDMELLASRSLAEAVVSRLALTAKLDAPEPWYRDSLLVSLTTSRETEEADFLLRWTTDGGLEVWSPEADSVLDSGRPGEPLGFGGLSAVVRPWHEGMPREMKLSTLPFATAVREARSQLSLERPRREANVVVLAYDDNDPGVARGVVQAAVEEFISLRTRIQARESGETSDSLRVVANRTAADLRQAEEALEEVQREGRIVAPDVQSEALVERQAELLATRQHARSQLAGVDEMLQRLDQVADQERSWTALLSYPAFLENQTLGQLLARLTELHGERDALASRRTAENLDLQVLEERIAYLDGSLRQVAQEYRAGLVEQLETLEPALASIDAQLTTLPAQAVELGRRQRDVRLLTEILLLTEQRLRQEELREALTYSNVQVIDAPALRDRPVWPRKVLGLLVVSLMALGTAFLTMMVRDRSDGRLRTGEGLRSVLDVPVLAVVLRGSDGRLAFSPAQVEVVRRRVPGHPLLVESSGARKVAAEVAEALGVAGAGSDPDPSPGSHQGQGALAARNGQLRSAGPVADHASAAELASVGDPLAVVVELGRTEARELARLRRLLEEVGAPVSGVILVCRSPSEAEAAWE